MHSYLAIIALSLNLLNPSFLKVNKDVFDIDVALIEFCNHILNKIHSFIILSRYYTYYFLIKKLKSTQ